MQMWHADSPAGRVIVFVLMLAAAGTAVQALAAGERGTLSGTSSAGALVHAVSDKSGAPQGLQPLSATSATASGIPNVAERSRPVVDSSWPLDSLDWATSPVDLSFLNAREKPAGKRGFLKTSGDKLVFEDGTTARFWGTNLTSFSLFATTRHEDVTQQARRLAQLGFNLVRLHHHDSDWAVPNIFGRHAADTQKLDEASLEKLDWWIKCLEDEGIYIWLDLHVGRRLTAGDKIEDFAEISGGSSGVDLRGFNYVDPDIERAMQRFNEAYLDHLNRYTGLRYKDDPGIAVMLITNENDVTNHFGNRLSLKEVVPHENSRYIRQAFAFAESNGLPKNQIWHSWEHGPSKLFLNDLEHNFNVAMIAQLRTLGVQSPVVTTSSWGKDPLSSLPSLTDGGIIDAHSYGQERTLDANPLSTPNLVSWIAAAQIVDRPLSVSEWNVRPFPVPDRHALPLYVAGAGDLQGWSALLQYAYSQQPLDSQGKADDWDAFNDPGLIATLPAAALLFRRHDAQEARMTYVFAPSTSQLFDQTISPGNAVALRTAAERGRLMIALPPVRELPWLKPSRIPEDAKVITDPGQSLIASGAEEATSDTGELTRNWRQGTFSIDTPRSQAVMGRLSGKMIVLSAVKFEIMTPNATVAVQSLDGRPIENSSALMITLGGRSIPAEDKLRFRSEPVVGRLTIAAPPGMRLYKRDAAQNANELPTRYANGRYQIELRADFATHWLIMREP